MAYHTGTSSGALKLMKANLYTTFAVHPSQPPPVHMNNKPTLSSDTANT